MTLQKEPEIKRYFFDTEFYDPEADGFGVEFISIGLRNKTKPQQL